jgi:hypothetical protein
MMIFPGLNTKNLIAWFMLCTIILSCSGVKRKYLIPEKKLISIIVDMNIADGITFQYSPGMKRMNLDSAAVYGWVLEKHDVTKAQFDSTIAYYTKHPDRLDRIYEKVIASLSKMESEIKEAEKEEALKRKITIWEDPRNYMLPDDGRINRINFSVPVKGPGEYTITAQIKVFRDDESIAPRINAFFWYDNGTEEGYRDHFKSVSIKRNEELNTYSVSKQLREKDVTHIKGYIYNHSNQDTLFLKHAFIGGIKITYESL